VGSPVELLELTPAESVDRNKIKYSLAAYLRQTPTGRPDKIKIRIVALATPKAESIGIPCAGKKLRKPHSGAKQAEGGL
jgi:hypothetical protein